MDGDLVKRQAKPSGEARCVPRGRRQALYGRAHDSASTDTGCCGADGVAAVAPGGGDSKIEFRLVEGVDSIERLALLDAIADLLNSLMPAPLSIGAPAVRARRFNCRQSMLGNDAVAGGTDVESQFADIVAARRGTLRVDDLLHLLQGRTAVEQLAGARVSGAATELRVILQEMCGEPQRLFAQVGRARARRWSERP